MRPIEKKEIKVMSEEKVYTLLEGEDYVDFIGYQVPHLHYQHLAEDRHILKFSKDKQ